MLIARLPISSVLLLRFGLYGLTIFAQSTPCLPRTSPFSLYLGFASNTQRQHVDRVGRAEQATGLARYPNPQKSARWSFYTLRGW